MLHSLVDSAYCYTFSNFISFFRAKALTYYLIWLHLRNLKR